jgi:hypothetical protein
MIPGQVREKGDIKMTGTNPLQLQGVGGDFYDGVGDPAWTMLADFSASPAIQVWSSGQAEPGLGNS